MINTTDFRGGAARVMSDLVKELRKGGHTVRCLVGYKYSGDKDTEEISSNWFWKIIEKRLSKKIRLYSRHLRSFLTSNDIDYFNENELINHPWFKEADVVHLHNLHGQYFNLNCLPKISKSKPVVWTMHDMWPITSHCGTCYDCPAWNGGEHFSPGISHYQPMLWDNSRYLFEKKQKIFTDSGFNLVTPSDWMKNLIFENKAMSKKSCDVISNGIDLKVFKKLDKNVSRRLLNLKSDGKIYIFVANKGLNDELKGGRYLKKMIKDVRYSNDLFVIVGGGKHVSDQNVKQFPYVSDKKIMANLYNAADVYLDFSPVESYGLARAEAIACGLKTLSLDDFSFNYKIPSYLKGISNFKEMPEVTSIFQMKEKYLKLYKRVLPDKK